MRSIDVGEFCARCRSFVREDADGCAGCRCVSGRGDSGAEPDEEPVREREVEAHRVAARMMERADLERTVRVMGSLVGDETHVEVWKVYRAELDARPTAVVVEVMRRAA